MKHLSSVLSFAVVTTLAAQDPQSPSAAPGAPADALQQTAARLQKSFATTAALPSCGFQAHWGPTAKKEQEAGDNAGGAGFLAVTLLGASPATGDAQGTWAQNGLHVAIGDDELRYEGRAMLAKDATRGWALRRDRFADGNKVGFVPDPQGLLAALRTMKLDAVHREAGALGDRPVEIVTVTLTPDQVAELAFCDLLPAGSNDSFGGGFAQVIGMAAAGNAQRPPAVMPETTVDLALYLDPGSGLLYRVHVRSYKKADVGVVGGRMVFVAGGAGGVRVRAGGVQDGEEEEEEAKEPEKAGAAPQFADGLPVRSKKKMTVTDFVLDLKDHGSALLPELDDTGKALLRR